MEPTNRDLRSGDSGRGHRSENRSLGRWWRSRSDAGRASHINRRFLGPGRVIRLAFDRVRRFGVV